MGKLTRHQLLVAFYAAYEAQNRKRVSSPEFKAFLAARDALREFDAGRAALEGET